MTGGCHFPSLGGPPAADLVGTSGKRASSPVCMLRGSVAVVNFTVPVSV